MVGESVFICRSRELPQATNGRTSEMHVASSSAAQPRAKGEAWCSRSWGKAKCERKDSCFRPRAWDCTGTTTTFLLF